MSAALDLSPALASSKPLAQSRLWVPKQVLITPSAKRIPHGAAIAERAAALGSAVVELPADRLTGLPERYVDAKRTLAVVVAPPSARRPQPIPPSADWRFDLAAGCPAHCQYCYLAGSLGGPPITRAYANLDEILDGLPAVLGQGRVTSKQAARAAEGTTYEASCYTDPLGIEHLTGSLEECVRRFGEWDAPVQLRFTTKYDNVTPLLGLPHGRRTRIRFSVNAAAGERYEGGTPRMPARLDAMRRAAEAGYRIGLTVAPIMPLPDWEAQYGKLLADAGEALARAATAGGTDRGSTGTVDPDLTVELITHRFTDASKTVLQGWYPGSSLDMDEAARSRKLTKFGGGKWVYPAEQMRTMRAMLERLVAGHLPQARVLYWT